VTLLLTSGRGGSNNLQQILQDVTEGPLGVNFDPAELAMAGNAPADAYRDLHAHVAHVLARDAVRDAALGVEVALGRGEVPWDELLALFDESGYTGWVTVDRTQGDDKPGDAARALQYLKQLALG
jgi:sugar phosphate isomerase/epimerase